MTPQRIQRQRTRGWRMPPNTVYVGRPTKFGNPYRIDSYHFVDAKSQPYRDDAAARAMAVRDFEMWLEVTERGRRVKALAEKELRGKHLACWCPLTEPCHVDVLLEIANRHRFS